MMELREGFWAYFGKRANRIYWEFGSRKRKKGTVKHSISFLWLLKHRATNLAA